jgi:hypothetical protein
MRILSRALLATAAIVGLVSSASAADLAYRVKAPMMAAPVYSWSGVYGGGFGGGAFADPRNYNLSADPTAVNTVSVGPAANGGYPIYSNAYNNLASGPFTVGTGPAQANAVTSVGFTGGGQVKNGVVGGGLNCTDGGNNCIGGAATTSFVPFTNPGTRTDSMIPTSQNSSQLAGLIGVEIGGRKQFDNNVVLGVGADIMAFMHGGSTTYNSQGAFTNSNGFTMNSAAQLCTQASGVGGICAISASPSVNGTSTTINTGSSTSSLTVNANPNWIGTVRASAGYAFDRLLLNVSGGFAYSDAKMNVTGSYNDKVTSSCNGTASAISSGGLALGSGSAFVSYQCGAAAVNAASVSQTVTTSVTYADRLCGRRRCGLRAERSRLADARRHVLQPRHRTRDGDGFGNPDLDDNHHADQYHDQHHDGAGDHGGDGNLVQRVQDDRRRDFQGRHSVQVLIRSIT